MHKLQFEDVDAANFKGCQDVHSRNVPLTGLLIEEKAFEFAEIFELENF